MRHSSTTPIAPRNPLLAGSFIIFVSLLTPSTSPAQTVPPAASFADTNGDVNADGKVDLSDAVSLLVWRFLGGPEPAPIRCEVTLRDNGDANGDGRRDISDAIAILGWLFSGGPEPVEACGVAYDLPVVPPDLELRPEQPDAVAIPVPPRIIARLRPEPVYQIRIHAIRTANDDGSEAATIKPEHIVQLVEQANTDYYSAGIEFLFDPARDFEQKNATVLNHDFTLLEDPTKITDEHQTPATDSTAQRAFRRAVADLHRSEIVVFFSWGDQLDWDDTVGHWVHNRRYFSSSSWSARYVNMTGYMPQINTLAHEIGHYLHNRHPFVLFDDVDSVRAAIRKYVEAGHPIEEGLGGIDGFWDRDFVLDTPPDAGTRVWGKVGIDPYAGVPLPVSVVFTHVFPPVQHLYRIDPDRQNLMSYYNPPGDDYRHLSPDQIRRTRTGLEDGNRHDLVSMPGGPAAYSIVRRGSADGGHVDVIDVTDVVDITRVSLRRLVTTTLSVGNLELTAWDVGEDGQEITRRGSIATGPASLVRAVGVGLDRLATAVRDGDGNLKVIVWKVTPAGELERQGSAVAGAASRIALARIGIELLGAAVRDESGNLRVIVFHLDASGNVELRGYANAGAVSEVSAAPAGSFGMVTPVRDSGGNLRVIAWQTTYDGVTVTRKETAIGGPVASVEGAWLDIDHLTTPVRTSSGRLEVIGWHVDHFGVVRRKGTVVADYTGPYDATRLGTSLLLTARRDPRGNLALDLFDSDLEGATITARAHASGEGIQWVAVSRVGTDQVATAVRTNSGRLRVIVWRVSRMVLVPRPL